MKNIQAFFLPALAAGVASLLASGIASADNVFVANNATGAVTEIAPDGSMSFFVNPGSAPAADNLVGPTGIAFNSAGDLYVAYNSGSLAEYNPNGSFDTIIATGLSSPRGIAFDTEGNLFVTNQSSHSITEIPMGTGAAETVVNNLLFPSTPLNATNDLTFDASGNMYVTNGGSNEIDKISFTSGGAVASVSPFATGLSAPNGIVYDSVGANAGNFFVVDHGDSTVVEFNSAGMEVSPTPFVTDTNAQDGPKSIAIDSVGNFYVTDTGDNTVTEYGPTGTILNTYSDSNFISGSGSIKTQTVPEPTTYALLFAGVGLLFFVARRKLALD